MIDERCESCGVYEDDYFDNFGYVHSSCEGCEIYEQGMRDIKPAKPHLAEILGVEVGEQFTFDYPNRQYRSAYISEDGIMWTVSPDGVQKNKIGATAMCWLINHLDSLKRLPKLNEQEIAICKAVGATWVSRDEGDTEFVRAWNVKPAAYCIDKTVYMANISPYKVVRLDASLFPSVKPGDCIEVPK